MTLKTLFAIPIAIILIVTLSLAGMIAGQGWSGQARGKAAVDAVERMRLLVDLQTDLQTERVVSNFALGRPYPVAEPAMRRLAEIRRDTDRGFDRAAASFREAVGYDGTREPYLDSAAASLAAIRGRIDAMLASPQAARTFATLNAMTPAMFAVSTMLDVPVEQAGIAVTVANSSLSGLMTEDRLTASLRDQVGLIAAVLLPRYNAGQPPTEGDVGRMRILLSRATFLTRLLADTIDLAGATDEVRDAIAALREIDLDAFAGQLDAGSALPGDGTELTPPQQLLGSWRERVNALRTALVDAIVERVSGRRDERERRFDIVLVAFGAVIVAVLESIVLLSQRVVGPLALLGDAITRMAAGDRGVALKLHSGTREIAEMVTAVETLRQAALIADATASRQRLAARHRARALREALGIVQTVREPARALERGVARLSEGIDATIALVAAATGAPPPTLGTAADAVRTGLADLRESAADLDATFAAASSAQTDERPEAEFVACILAVQAQVDRWSLAVRRFVQPSLIALRDASLIAPRDASPIAPRDASPIAPRDANPIASRDASPIASRDASPIASRDANPIAPRDASAIAPRDASHATDTVPAPVLRELVSDQFERIEETVATVASMIAAVTRAAAIVHDLPAEQTPIAA